jgi:hypothetical protein
MVQSEFREWERTGETPVPLWTYNEFTPVEFFPFTDENLDCMFPFKFLPGAAAIAGAVLCLPCPGLTQVNVLTYHNDNARTGANLNETILTPSNVNTNTFGQLFTYAVDGYVYAQPLYVSGVNIPGQGTHNALYVATEHNSVYCLDADSDTGANTGILWQVNLGPSAPCPVDGFRFEAIEPEVGITSTPVIDPVSQTLYVDAFTTDGTNYFHKIHALSLADGSERSFSPVLVNASIPGTGTGSTNGVLPFLAIQELQRSALTLAGNILYAAFAGYTDTTATDPFHGWIIGFSSTNLQLLPDHIFNSTPNGTVSQFGADAGEAGVWMAGDGLASDSESNLYVATGDGNFNAYFGGAEYGNSVIKFSTGNGLSVADYFTTWNEEYFRTNDLDVGSGGVMLLPDQPGPYPHLMIAGGKPQRAYLLNRDMMTTDNQHFNSGGSSDNIVQTMPLGGGAFDTPAYFNEGIYYVASHDTLRYYVVSNGTLIPDLPGTFASRTYPFPGATPSISANGTNDAIAWTIQNDSPTVLVAYNATNLTTEIYSSDLAGARDQLADGVKFAVPTIANGKVYVGGQYEVAVFGLLGGALQFSSTNYAVSGSTNSATITVNRAGGSQGAVQVGYATTSDGSAVPGQDYISTSGTLSWPDGDASPKSFNVSILNNAPASTNKTISLTLSNATSGAYLADQSNAVLTILEDAYTLWKFSHFGDNADNPDIAGDNADPDHDGIPNILEYAFGSDPNSPDTNPPLSGIIVSNRFQLQFNRNTSATDLTYTAQVTPALDGDWSNLMTYFANGGWITNTPGSTVTESGTPGSAPDQHTQVTITDPTDTTSATNRFFRLQVQP